MIDTQEIDESGQDEWPITIANVKLSAGPQCCYVGVDISIDKSFHITKE